MNPELLRDVALGSLARSTSGDPHLEDENRYGIRLEGYPALAAFITTMVHEVDKDTDDGHLGFDQETIGYSEGLLHGIVTALNILAEYVEVSELRDITDS